MKVSKIHIVMLAILLSLAFSNVTFGQVANVVTRPFADNNYLRLDGTHPTVGKIFFGEDIAGPISAECSVPTEMTITLAPMEIDGILFGWADEDGCGTCNIGLVHLEFTEAGSLIYQKWHCCNDYTVTVTDTTFLNHVSGKNFNYCAVDIPDLDIQISAVTTSTCAVIEDVVREDMDGSAYLAYDTNSFLWWNSADCTWSLDLPWGWEMYDENCGSDCNNATFSTSEITSNSTFLDMWKVGADGNVWFKGIYVDSITVDSARIDALGVGDDPLPNNVGIAVQKTYNHTSLGLGMAFVSRIYPGEHAPTAVGAGVFGMTEIYTDYLYRNAHGIVGNVKLFGLGSITNADAILTWMEVHEGGTIENAIAANLGFHVYEDSSIENATYLPFSSYSEMIRHNTASIDNLLGFDVPNITGTNVTNATVIRIATQDVPTSGYAIDTAWRTIHRDNTPAIFGDDHDFEIKYNSTDGELQITDPTGDVVTFGRGAVNTNITYTTLKNASGTVCYIYPNETGDGIVVSTTKP